VLPGTPAEGAKSRAERVRAAVRDLAIPHEASPGRDRVTISVGVATVSGAWTAAQIVALADRALYEAKAAGRDCEIAVDDEHPPTSVRRP
jgi:diguanylate cyclase (GGDEF)-like protein